MYSHIYMLSEKGLVFYLYLQKFHMDFSLSTVIFATADFNKRQFFLRHTVSFHKPSIRFEMRIQAENIISPILNCHAAAVVSLSESAPY